MQSISIPQKNVSLVHQSAFLFRTLFAFIWHAFMRLFLLYAAKKTMKKLHKYCIVRMTICSRILSHSYESICGRKEEIK